MTFSIWSVAEKNGMLDPEIFRLAGMHPVDRHVDTGTAIRRVMSFVESRMATLCLTRNASSLIVYVENVKSLVYCYGFYFAGFESWCNEADLIIEQDVRSGSYSMPWT